MKHLPAHLLMVDDDPGFLEAMSHWLAAKSGGRWRIDTASDTAGALSFLQQHRVDLVLVDIKMPVVDGQQFLHLLARRHPHLRKLVLSGFATEEIRDNCLRHGAEIVIEKPRNAAEFESVFITLQEVLALQPAHGFQGVLRQVGLPDILQMECLNRNSCVLEIQHRTGTAQIVIDHGAIVHAEIEDLSGEPAFNRILSLAGGEFRLKPFAEPPARTVEGQWEFLLMEAARHRDERQDEPSPNDQTTETPQLAAATLPPRANEPTEITEFLVCSGHEEVLHQWQCDNIPARLKLLSVVGDQGRLLAQRLPLGQFDRAEVWQGIRRTVVKVAQDRKLLVVSRPRGANVS